MSERYVIDYKPAFELLSNVIINREFGSLIEVQKWIVANQDDLVFNADGERFDLALRYVYYLMLDDQEKRIFPYIKKHILKSNFDTCAYYSKKRCEDVFLHEHKDTTLEEKYIFYIGMQGFYDYSKKAGLPNLFEHIDRDKFTALLEMMYNTNYTKFDNTNLQGLFFWRAFGDMTLLSVYEIELLDSVLRDIAVILADPNRTAADCDGNECVVNEKIQNEIDKINLVD